MSQLVKRKEKKSKPKAVEHVHIIDDDVPIPWGTTATATTTTKTTTAAAIAAEPDPVADDEIVSFEDAPVIVGIVDERPTDIREKERFKDVKRWRTAAFEELPEPESIGPQLNLTKSSRSKQNASDDSDPDIDRRQSRRNDDPDLSPPRRKTQRNNDDDPSPPRRRRPVDDDNSNRPQRKREDPSPPRKRPQTADNDSSPPRRRDKSPRRRKHDDSSPPRRRSQTADNDSSPPRQRDSSPPRKRYPKDDDTSPPRRREKSSHSHRRNDQYSRKESSSSSTQRRQPKEEPSSPASTHRRSKQESSPPRSSEPVKSERRRLAEHKEKLAERYTHWGRGLAQVQQADNAVKDYLEQAQKPLARYRDDQDLDALLKQQQREDDPMLKYLSNKPADVGDGKSSSNQPPVKPRYRGPEPQKNRFDIWPGYRWDGVDRSNGYERKLFESIASRHARAQEAYLWSVEDM